MIGYIVDAFAVFGLFCLAMVVFVTVWTIREEAKSRKERGWRPLGFNGR